MAEKRGNWRSAVAAIVAGTILVALSLGPGRTILASAAETLYSAWLFARYLVLAVPGGVWWAMVIVAAIGMALRSVVLAIRKTDRAVAGVAGSTRAGGPPKLTRRARVSDLAFQLERSAQAASSRANIDRTIAEIAALRLGAPGWSRRYADELADDPRIAAYPQLRQVVRQGPDYGQRSGAFGSLLTRLLRPASYRAGVERRKASELSRVDALLDGLSQLETEPWLSTSSSIPGEQAHE